MWDLCEGHISDPWPNWQYIQTGWKECITAALGMENAPFQLQTMKGQEKRPRRQKAEGLAKEGRRKEEEN